MGYSLEILNDTGIPKEVREDAETCFVCGESITRGGTWMGQMLLSICNKPNCIENHIKWTIDAYTSTEGNDIRYFKTKDEFMRFVEKVYDDKAAHPIHNK